MLNFDNILSINNWDMAQNVILQKGRALERSRSQVKINGIIIILDLKNIDLDTKIIILDQTKLTNYPESEF